MWIDIRQTDKLKNIKTDTQMYTVQKVMATGDRLTDQ